MKAQVLIVDDEAGLRRALADRIRFWGHEPTEAGDGEAALAATARSAFDLILLDLAMPGAGGMAVLQKLRAEGNDAVIAVVTAHGSVENAVEAVKKGADEFLVKPADFDVLKKILDRAVERGRLRRVVAAQEGQLSARGALIEGTAPVMRELLDTARRAAQSDSTVLLNGESGTGKQLLAEFVHAQSERARGPFVYVNCVAISDELIESTLFGHEKGAFTGAVARKTGRLETAHGGTAFLDEIGDVSPKLQTKLLHFLESGEFERVGGDRVIRVDCRLIAATNKDLPAEVAAGRFREDLYYRLNVIALRIPPLRERPEDIPVLAEAFLAQLTADLKRELRFDPRALEALARYRWPGNVRQLRNAMERMAVLAPAGVLTLDLLPPEVRLRDTPGDDPLELPYKEGLVEFKRRVVRAALDREGGNQTRAAERLGLQRTYLNRLIKELGIE